MRTLEDGIGSFDVADVGPDHGIPIDPLSAQSIEVMRGAATLRYGSQAIGGVINAINNRVPSRLPDEPFAAELTGLYGTNADTRQGSAMFDARLGSFAIHADGFKRKADDYDIPGRHDGELLLRRRRLFARRFLPVRQESCRRRGDPLRLEYGIPGEEAFIDMKQTKELLRTSFAPGIGAFHTLTIEGGHADYEHSESEIETGEVGSTFKDDEWDARSRGVVRRHRPVFGRRDRRPVPEPRILGAGRGRRLSTADRDPVGGGVRVRGCAAVDAPASACRRTRRIRRRRRHARG